MINYGKHFIDQSDINSVIKVLRSNKITQGPYVELFESKLKNYFGSKYSLAVNSGTAALHLACLSLNISSKDRVVTTPITFISTINSAIYNNAKISLIDIDAENYCMDLFKLEKFLKKTKVKAVIFVDYAGNVMDWEKIKYLSKKYSFYSINDNCHAMGSALNNNIKYACKYADVVTQSYHPVKAFTTGEGGSLQTNNRKIYNKALILRSHGMIRNVHLSKKKGNWYYGINDLGYNYRISDINCALGVSQIKKINKFVQKRRSLAKIYDKNFSNMQHVKIPKIKNNIKHSYHLYVLLVNFSKFNINKRIFFDKLKKIGINLQVHYIPIHYHNYIKRNYFSNKVRFPIAENFYNCAISLPIYYDLSYSNQLSIIYKIKKLLNSRK